MEDDGRLGDVFLHHEDLQVPCFAFNGAKHSGVSQSIDALVHARQRVRIVLGYQVQSSIVHVEPGGLILFRNDHDEGSPI